MISQYETYLRSRPDLLAAQPTLTGKRLGCWCAPQAYHGDVLVKVWREGYIAAADKFMGQMLGQLIVADLIDVITEFD